MKQKISILLLSACCIFTNAQTVKIDINESSRNNMEEVLEPGYTPWTFGQVPSAEITESGVTFTLTAVGPGETPGFRTGWDKALVQNLNLIGTRLVNDGVIIDNEIMAANPGMPAIIELKISGLSVGHHTIQTYHNTWSTRPSAPFNVFLNGTLIHSEIVPSVRVSSVADANILFTGMQVTEAGQDMVLRFEAIPGVAEQTDPKWFDNGNVFLNAFDLDVIDRSQQAANPIPYDKDIHIDADDGAYTLKWDAATNGKTASHVLYFGIDEEAVSEATVEISDIYKGTFPLATTEYPLTGLYSMNTYYWRVDQINTEGQTTKGEVWSFKPRRLAFEEAEGYGRFASGGRGGHVVYVTNLNNDGPGSFREAATDKSGPRTIVFNVSGLIRLSGRLVIDPFVTVAGQTAPGKGICFTGAPMGVGDESITRFIRTRLGAGDTGDGLGATGADHSIIDHCSIGWSIDEAFSSRNARNITLQRTMISESLNEAGHKNYPEGSRHGYAGSVGGDVGSLHHNLLAHNNGRNWSLAGGLDGAGYYKDRMDVFNMVVYNWDGRTTDGGAHEVNFVNNYYKHGPAGGTQNILVAQLEGTGKGSQSYYVKGNIRQLANGSFACDGTNDMCAVTQQVAASQVVDWDVWVDEPFFPSYATIHSAKDAYKTVMSDVGCTLPVLDDHDKRIIRETLTGTYTYRGSKTNIPGIIDDEADVGGHEDYGAEVRPAGFDTDMDGLPDWWETGVSKTTPDSPAGDFSDSNSDPDKDGFTLLEDYLEWKANPNYYLENSMQLDLSEFTKGFEKNPVHRIVNSKNCNVTLDGTVATVTKNKMDDSPLASFEFEIEDAEGFKMTRLVNFNFANATGIEAPVANAKVIAGKSYFDLLGRSVPEGTKGLLIEKVTYKDGSFNSRKLFVK